MLPTTYHQALFTCEPQMHAAPYDPGVLETILRTHADQPGATLPVLHAVQEAFGYIPAESVEPIARRLHLSRAEVHGVITYYHHFRDARPGQTVVQMCRAEACQARGANALIEHAQTALACTLGATRDDGSLSLEPVFCLGHCASGPNIQIDDKLYGRVSVQKFDRLTGSLMPLQVVSS